jgi:hypothetical protein
MNYYIYKGSILNTEADLSAKDGIIVLNEEQFNFAIDKPNATISEILNCELVVNNFEVTEQYIYDIKEMVYLSYSECEARNTGASGTLKIAQFAQAGCSKAIANVQWVTDLYTEMYSKIEQISNGNYEVDLFPSESIKQKPYSYRECEEQYISLIQY